MTMNEHSESWLRLLSVLEAEEDLSTQEIESKLKAEGVDTDAFLTRMETTIRQSIQAQWKQEAEKEKLDGSLQQQSLIEIATWSIDKVREWLKSAVEGAFGPQVQELAIPCHRNKEDGELSDDELRSWVADIQSTLEKSKKPHDT